MKIYTLLMIFALSSSLCIARQRSYKKRYKRPEQSLTDFCRECCKDPNPSAECKKRCGDCEMYSDEGKSGASNFPGN